jgi:hypothetical protein
MKKIGLEVYINGVIRMIQEKEIRVWVLRIFYVTSLMMFCS